MKIDIYGVLLQNESSSFLELIQADSTAIAQKMARDHLVTMVGQANADKLAIITTSKASIEVEQKTVPDKEQARLMLAQIALYFDAFDRSTIIALAEKLR